MSNSSHADDSYDTDHSSTSSNDNDTDKYDSDYGHSSNNDTSKSTSN